MITSPYGDYLPLFPCLDYAPITEDRIERTVEKLFDIADSKLTTTDTTQEQYNAWCKALNRWVSEQYRKIDN